MTKSRVTGCARHRFADEEKWMKKIHRSLFFTIALILSFTFLAPTIGNAGALSDDIDQRIDKILSQMTLDEKIDYIGGLEGPKAANMYVRGIPRLNVPPFKM